MHFSFSSMVLISAMHEALCTISSPTVTRLKMLQKFYQWELAPLFLYLPWTIGNNGW